LPEHLPLAADDSFDLLPGWAMGPLDGRACGIRARGSWLLEPETGSGMLLYPRDWSFTERRDVYQHLRSQGWAVVPFAQFFDVTTDGQTVIRLLDRKELPVGAGPSAFAEVREIRLPPGTTAQVQASV